MIHVWHANTKASHENPKVANNFANWIKEKCGNPSRSAGYGMTETVAVGGTMSGCIYDLKPNASGLANYLTGACTPPEVLQATDHSTLALMSTGPLPPNPAELLASPKLFSLLSNGLEVSMPDNDVPPGLLPAQRSLPPGPRKKPVN